MKKLLTGLLIAALVFLPALVSAQVVDDIEENTNTTVNVTDNTDNTDNSQDNDPINVSENQVVVVYCYVENKIEEAAYSEQEAEDVDTDQDVDVEDNTLNDNNTLGDLVATQTTTLDQEASVVATFEQRGCDVHVEYKTNPAPTGTVVVPTPIVVTNTVTNNTETVRTVTAERAVNLPESAPATGGY